MTLAKQHYLRQGMLSRIPSEELLLVEGCVWGPAVCGLGEVLGVGGAGVWSPPPSGDSRSFSSYCNLTSSNCKTHTHTHIYVTDTSVLENRCMNQLNAVNWSPSVSLFLIRDTLISVCVLPSECFYVRESHGTEGANRFNLPSLYRSVNILSAADGNANCFPHICTEHAPPPSNQIHSCVWNSHVSLIWLYLNIWFIIILVIWVILICKQVALIKH